MTWNARRVRLAVILALGACLQAVLLWMELRPRPRALWGDEIMYVDVASRWARGEPATLELLWPPLYPFLLAQGDRVGQTPEQFARVLNVVAAAVTAALVALLTERLSRSALAAACVVALYILYQPTLLLWLLASSEAPFTPLFLGGVLLLAQLVFRPTAGAAAAFVAVTVAASLTRFAGVSLGGRTLRADAAPLAAMAALFEAWQAW